MEDNLVKHPPRVKAVAFKMHEIEFKEMMDLVDEKNWNTSAFIRVAIKKEIERIRDDSED